MFFYNIQKFQKCIKNNKKKKKKLNLLYALYIKFQDKINNLDNSLIFVNIMLYIVFK